MNLVATHVASFMFAAEPRFLLTLVFFAVVTPIGLARKLLGIDSLKLKDFKSSETSVMVIRNHIFTGEDIEKPY